jgi:MarR family transcriptional regulator, temperature-dependent positive regulator of motility
LKKLIVLTLAIAFIFPLFTTNADAAYLQEKDIIISIETDKPIPQFLNEDFALMMFEAQEQLIQLLEDNSGMEIDHYYIWIEINGVKVLAIDPPVLLF